MFVTFAIIYAMCFYSVLDIKGISIGLPMGMAMGYCCANSEYYYEGHEGGKPLGNSVTKDI